MHLDWTSPASSGSGAAKELLAGALQSLSGTPGAGVRKYLPGRFFDCMAVLELDQEDADR